MGAEVELTELEKLEVSRVDGVASPANGFPVLLLKSLAKAPMDADGKTEGPTHGAFGGRHTHKHAFGDDEHEHAHSHDGDGDHGHDHAGKSAGPPPWHAGAKVLIQLAKALPDAPPDSLWLSMRWAQPDLFDQAAKAIAADGSVDEQPDIDGGKQAIALIAKLIGYEADELAAGCLNETWDIQLLCEAAGALKCWLGGEQATADGMDGTLMQGAAKAAESTKTQNDLPDSAFAYIEPGGTKDSEGKTTPRSKRHFPVHDKAHADNAAARIAQGAEFGDKAKPKVEAAQRKFGEDTSKSTVAEGATDVQTDAQGTGDLTEIVKATAEKAAEPLVKRIAELESVNKSLEARLAKVEAAPVPGGPMLSRNVQVKQPGGVVNDDWAAKAALYRQKASDAVSPADREGYRQLAREAEEKSRTPLSA